MAQFSTHITASTVLGVGYGALGHLHYGVPLPAAMLAGGLCSIAGMLPDLDSDSGVPIRESMAFLAAVTPMLMLDRFRQLGLADESVVLAGGLVYIIVRFGVAELLRRYTVHRGMWHSLPAAAIAGLIVFLLCSNDHVALRLYKTGGVLLGYLSHLLLDELYSVGVRRGRLRVKRSLGSALKMWGKSPWANISTYGKLGVLIALTLEDPAVMKYVGNDQPPVYQRTAQQVETHRL